MSIEYLHYEEKNENGTFKKCQNDNEGNYYLNKEFGCIYIPYSSKCLECDNLYGIFYCTKCLDG